MEESIMLSYVININMNLALMASDVDKLESQLHGIQKFEGIG